MLKHYEVLIQMELDKNRCDECGSLYFLNSSKMKNLCPECANALYGYPNCQHVFENGRCIKCYWDDSKSVFVNKIKVK